MRARMALLAAGIVCELREVLLRNKPAHMVELSPKGTVPVLLLPDGTVIDESLDVMYWALAQSDRYAWLTADSDRSAQLIAANDGPFKAQLDRYKYWVRFPEHTQRHYRDQALAHLARLEDALHRHDGAGLCCSRPTVADYALLPFVRQFSKVEPQWFAEAPYPQLRSWLHTLEQSALFRTVMLKYPVWAEGNPVTLFGEALTGTSSNASNPLEKS